MTASKCTPMLIYLVCNASCPLLGIGAEGGKKSPGSECEIGQSEKIFSLAT